MSIHSLNCQSNYILRVICGNCMKFKQWHINRRLGKTSCKFASIPQARPTEIEKMRGDDIKEHYSNYQRTLNMTLHHGYIDACVNYAFQHLSKFVIHQRTFIVTRGRMWSINRLWLIITQIISSKLIAIEFSLHRPT